MKQSQPTTVLKEREERRFEEFFIKFSRSAQTLTFAELLMFALDRNLIQNKHSIGMLLQQFDDAVDPKLKGERYLTKPQFYSLLTHLSLHIYHNDRNHLDRLMADILSEKNTVARDQTIEVQRQLILDETNKRILSENSIRALCQYETEMKNLFTIYMQENLQRGAHASSQPYIMLKWKELAMLNKRMNMNSLIRFLRDSEIIPHIISIEQFTDSLVKVVPAVNNKEYEFYQKQHTQSIYEKQLVDQFEGDPQVGFHEFQLLLARLAFEIGAREEVGIGQNRKFDAEKYINKFLGEIMLFRTNQNQDQPLPNLNRRVIKNLEKYQLQLGQDESDYEPEGDSDEGEGYQEQLDRIAAQQQGLLFEQVSISFSVEQVMKMLDKELPELPQAPHPRTPPKERPPMRKFEPDQRIVIGKPKPESPKNKNEKPKPKKAKQAQRRKQGEPEPRPLRFDEHKPYPKQSEQYVMELSEKLKHETKLVSDVERGSLSDIQVAPVLIAEILYPPNPPATVQVKIEAAINAHNDGNFVFAIQCYDEARKLWAALQGREMLTDGLELFFEFTKGGVYESAGRDDMALSAYLSARLFSNKLPTNNPDKALVYCGMGSVFFNMEEYEWALRSYLKAREYRENCIGIETVDTATVFNNLGCCMLMLERNKEANAYFKLSHAVLETNLGPFHPRTLTAARNINKSNNCWIEQQPEYPKLWVAYEQDRFAGGKKKKKKKGKK